MSFFSDLIKPEVIPTYSMDRIAICTGCKAYKEGQKYICGKFPADHVPGYSCGCYLPKKVLIKDAKCPQKKW